MFSAWYGRRHFIHSRIYCTSTAWYNLYLNERNFENPISIIVFMHPVGWAMYIVHVDGRSSGGIRGGGWPGLQKEGKK